jgi:hypothetical protein
MTEVSFEPNTWSPRQWVGVTGIIFVIQLGFIFWLGDRQPIRPRKPSAAPAFQLTGSVHSEWLALTDPTLFALPHARVFSGPAWLKTVPPSSRPFEWTEEPRWLGLPVQLLGASFSQLVISDSSLKWQVAEIPEPRALLPEVTRAPLLPRSSLRVEGGLAQRRLLSQPVLPAWPPRTLNPTDTDMLASTVVQVLVDAEGKPVSLTLLGSSGYAPADDLAMSLATGFRFEPLQTTDPLPQVSRPGALLGLSWGQVVFEWQTLGSTNTPAGSP